MKSLAAIDEQVVKLFSAKWSGLHEDKALARPDLSYPGVYLIAYSAKAGLQGSPIMPLDVFYIGMSNAAGGVRQRLKQFKTGIEKNGHHSGAMRFYREYGGGKPFAQAQTGKHLYYAALTFQCESNKGLAQPDDLRLMGHINCIEYYAIAHIAEQTGKNPPLNKLGPRPNE